MKQPQKEPGSLNAPSEDLDPTGGEGGSEGLADLALVRAALDGERTAISDLVERLGMIPRVLHCKNARMGRPLSREDLEDISQEILSTVWRKLESFHGGSPLEAWVYRFCSLTLMNALRRRRRQPIQGDLSGEAELAQSAPEVHGEYTSGIASLLDRLSEDQARPIRMRIYDELPFQRIAELLELPLTTAKARYYRGLESLRRMLDGGAQGDIS